ncbi:MAG: sugar phosphate isomerase/epimerase family protein [Candidatus Ornithospirochaeta sp.]
MVNRSIVLSAIVKNSATDPFVLSDSLSRLEKTKIDTIELYFPFEKTREMKSVISDHGIRNIVYPIAGVQKMKGFSLCDLNERNRMNAIFLLLRAFETANEVGAKKVLITTGRDTDECDREKALEQFMKSMERLLPEAENFDVVLETGDRTVDARQLLGPTDLSIEVTEEIRKKYNNFYLTLDTSHIAQLGENVEDSIEKALSLSNHVHLASCILTPGHPLYGDKHPFFSDPDGVLSDERLHNIFDYVVKRSEEEKRDILIGHEVIDRSGERLGGLEKAIEESPWFFL